VAWVRLDLDGSMIRTPRTTEPAPSRLLLRRTDEGLVPKEGPPLDDAMVAALHLLVDPEVRVDVDVAARRSGRERRLHSWQGLRDGRVATISTVDGRSYELSWFANELWRLELARAATVTLPVSYGTGRRVLPDRVELPYELLLASGEAWHRRRTDLIAELGRRLGGDVRVDGGSAPGDRTPLLIGLHGGTTGRLQAHVRVCGRVGRISWLRYGDAWWQLTPYPSDGERFVRVERVDELRLGVEVSRLVTGVRA
jgi:hypothetical protein